MSKVIKKFISIKGQVTGLYTNRKSVAAYRERVYEMKVAKSEFRELQITALEKFQKKVISGAKLILDQDGDSLTYGQDEFSEDKRQSFADPTLDTTVQRDNAIQAGITYPETMLRNLSKALPNKIKVNNRGVSGMHAETNLEVWKHPSGADIHTIMLGTNDCRKNITIPSFFHDMSNIIERRLEWGAAVILLKPPYKREPDKAFLEVYREIFDILGEIYAAPVWDVEEYFRGRSRKELYCDKVHLNSKGYETIGIAVSDQMLKIVDSKEEISV